MHFDVADIERVHIGVSDDPLEDRCLIAFVRSSDGVCLATMICVCPCNDTENRIIVRLSILPSLENDRPYGVSAAITASFIIKSITISYEK